MPMLKSNGTQGLTLINVLVMILMFVPEILVATNVQISGGVNQKLYGRISVETGESVRIASVETYENNGLAYPALLNNIDFFLVDSPNEYFFKTDHVVDTQRFPLIIEVTTQFDTQNELYWINLSKNSVIVENPENIRAPQESYRKRLDTIGSRNSGLEGLLSDLTFKLNQLEAKQGISPFDNLEKGQTNQNSPNQSISVNKPNQTDYMTQTSNAPKPNQIEDPLRSRDNQGASPSQTPVSLQGIDNNWSSTALLQLVTKQELLNSNLLLKILAFFSGCLSLIVLYFAIIAKMPKQTSDNSSLIHQELHKRDIIEHSILLRERNLLDRINQTNSMPSITPVMKDSSDEARDLVRQILDEYINSNSSAGDLNSNLAMAQQVQKSVSTNASSAQNLDSERVKPNNENEKNQYRESASVRRLDETPTVPDDEIKKLQVATVYYNMGDISMARSLCKELMNSKSNSIRKDAQELLSQIDR